MGRQNISKMGKFVVRSVTAAALAAILYEGVQEGLERVGEALASSASEMFSGYQSHRR
jgi:hypothetical protein